MVKKWCRLNRRILTQSSIAKTRCRLNRKRLNAELADNADYDLFYSAFTARSAFKKLSGFSGGSAFKNSEMLTKYRFQIAATAFIVLTAIVALNLQGRVWLCEVGDPWPWSWAVWSKHN